MILGTTTENQPVVFDSRFLPPFLVLLALVLLITLGVGLAHHGAELFTVLARTDYLLFLLGFVGALMLYVLLVNSLSAVKVSDNGLSAVTLLLDRHFRDWEHLYGARVRNVLGLKILLIDADDLTRPLLVPLFMHGLDVFVELVCANAGEDSDLAKLLRRF